MVYEGYVSYFSSGLEPTVNATQCNRDFPNAATGAEAHFRQRIDAKLYMYRPLIRTRHASGAERLALLEIRGSPDQTSRSGFTSTFVEGSRRRCMHADVAPAHIYLPPLQTPLLYLRYYVSFT